MSTPTAPDSDDLNFAAAVDQPTIAAPTPPATGNPDPITGEPGAHPVGVGVGALSAGAAGAAIGSIGGPVGMLIGAAIGAVAGGLAGKEVAASAEVSPAADVAADGGPPLTLPVDAPTPITMGSVPGEGFHASSGSGIVGDTGMLTTGASGWTTVPETGTGLRAPAVPETTPLAAETIMPHSGEEAVRVAAYYLYLDRSAAGQSGNAMGDWLEAEREMMLG